MKIFQPFDRVITDGKYYIWNAPRKKCILYGITANKNVFDNIVAIIKIKNKQNGKN